MYGCCEKFEVLVREPVNLTRLMVIDTLTDRLTSVRNRYVEQFGGVYVLSLCFLLFRLCRGFSNSTGATENTLALLIPNHFVLDDCPRE